MPNLTLKKKNRMKKSGGQIKDENKTGRKENQSARPRQNEML